MKKIFLTVLAFVIASVVYSQSSVLTVDSRLKSKYSDEYLDFYKTNYPEDILYLNWLLDNAYVIKDIPEGQTYNYPNLKYFDKETKQSGCVVTEFNPATFNIMEYDFEISVGKSNTYQIADAKKVISFYSSEYLTKKYNKYLNEKK